jgi:hypothetical protein
METKSIIATAVIGLLALMTLHQYGRLSELSQRLDQMEIRDEADASRVPAQPARNRSEQKAEIKARLERANQRSKTERRERWKDLWRQSLVEEIDAFAAENNIPGNVAEEIADIVEVHSEDSRLRWEQVHEGTLELKDARQQTEAARRALREEMEEQIGLSKWEALDERLDLGRAPRR